jgi:hypothetical protein
VSRPMTRNVNTINMAGVLANHKFDSEDSRVTFYGALIVADQYDHLREGWRTPASGLVSLDVEEHWFKVVMATASTYPYVKQ